MQTAATAENARFPNKFYKEWDIQHEFNKNHKGACSTQAMHSSSVRDSAKSPAALPTAAQPLQKLYRQPLVTPV